MTRAMVARMAHGLIVAAFATISTSSVSLTDPLSAFRRVDDVVAEPLGGHSGDAIRGRAVVLDRARGNCLICHTAPEPDERFMGELGPPLAGVGGRLSVAQLRLRLIDQRLLNPKTIMPPYYVVDGLTRVAAQYRGKTVLTAQEIEDAVAYLATLKE